MGESLEASSVKVKSKKDPASLPPIRIKREFPTLDEAVFAAQGLTDDLEQQVTIAASLMNMSEDEVRPQVVEANAKARRVLLQPVVRTTSPSGRAVIVERQPSRRFDQRVRTFNLQR
jgi:hypothetical protein